MGSGPRFRDRALASGRHRWGGLVGPHLGGCSIAVALEDPAPVVGVLEGVEGAAEVFDGVEAPDPQQVLLETRMKRSAHPWPSGSRTKAGELSRPRTSSSCGKSKDTNWEPWSWRRRTPRATPALKAPKLWRVAWRSGSNTSMRVPHLASRPPASLDGPSDLRPGPPCCRASTSVAAAGNQDGRC